MHSVLNSAGSFRQFHVQFLVLSLLAVTVSEHPATFAFGFLSLSLCAAALLHFSMGCAGSKAAKDEDSNPMDKVKTVDVDSSVSRPTTSTSTSQMADASVPAPRGESNEDENENTTEQPPRTNDDDDGKRLRCSYCYDDLDCDEAQIPKPCSVCRNKVCGACIGKQFTMACKDMSDMPPRCCTVPFNLAFAMPYLAEDEVAVFKARYEEWRTVSPVYCPVPTCAAFIPYRYFPVEKRAPRDRKPRDLGLEILEESMALYGRTVREIDSTYLPPELSEVVLPEPETLLESIVSIACPTCTTQVCCDCKKVAHPGSPCSKSNLDIDPEFEETLRMLNIKRCPKCHAGVRRMFGCSHILCRCGGQWCWQCNKYIEECDREGCRDDGEYDPSDDDEDYDEDEDEDETSPEPERENGNNADEHNADENNANRDADNAPETQPQPVAVAVAVEEGKGQTEKPPRDLDRGGRDRWDDSERFNFGTEGDRNRVDPWDCEHSFEMQTEQADESARFCENCWREVIPQSLPYPEAAQLMETGSIDALDANDEEGIGTQLSLKDRPEGGYFSCSHCHWILCDHCLGDLGYTAVQN